MAGRVVVNPAAVVIAARGGATVTFQSATLLKEWTDGDYSAFVKDPAAVDWSYGLVNPRPCAYSGQHWGKGDPAVFIQVKNYVAWRRGEFGKTAHSARG